MEIIMKIIPYQDKYRDDLIFMILEAKNALGRVPGFNEDLLDIQKNYNRRTYIRLNKTYGIYEYDFL